MTLDKIKLTISGLLLMLLLSSQAFCADYSPTMPGMPGNSNSNRKSGNRRSRQPRVRQSRAQKLAEVEKQRQEFAQNAQQEISENYKLIIDTANSIISPNKPDLRKFKKTVLKNKRYLPVLEDQMRCDYHVLAAWTYHFAGKDTKILSQAQDAQKIDPLNKNALATRISMGVLYQRYDTIIEALTQTQAQAEPETKKIKPPQQQKKQPQFPGMPMGMPEGMGMMGDPAEYNPKKISYKRGDGQLELDPNLIRIDLLEKTFDPNIETLSDIPVSDTDANSVLCVLLWKLDETDLDLYKIIEEPNEPNEPELEKEAPAKPELAQPVHPDMMMPPGMMMPPMKQQNAQQGKGKTKRSYKQSTRIDSEITDFAKMAYQLNSNEDLRFIMVNINAPSDRKTVENYLKYNPFQTLIPTMILTDFDSLNSAFIEKAENPTLLIIDSNEIVRYAGTTSGFLPEMVIQQLLSSPVKIEKEKVEELLPIIAPLAIEPPPQIKEEVVPVKPTQKTPDIKPKVVAQQDDDYFDPQAEQLLATAKSLLKIGNVMIQSHSYGKPVEMCRKVIREHPSTKYEDQARTLLRLVPDRYHRRYKITDEELGL